MKNPMGERLWGFFVFMLGALIFFVSAVAIHRYFATGSIEWGRLNRRLNDEAALLAHGLQAAVGACAAAAGLARMITNRSKDVR
jgi:hypothetical protein